MSFILDALKKSESAHQRQAGPGLFEVKVVPPRRTPPAWAMVIGVLLVINAAAFIWLLLSRTVPTASRRSTAAARPSVGASRPAAPTGKAGALPPAATQSVPGGFRTDAAPPTVARAPEPGTRTPARSAPIAIATPTPGILAPALEPATSSVGLGASSGVQGALPLYAQIAARPGSDLPKLHLDLNVYSPVPSRRFAMINMRVLHIGQSLPDGVRVVAIRPDGVALSYHGRAFLLPR